MAAPAYSSIVTKVLSIYDTEVLFHFLFHFFRLLLIIANMGVCSESVQKYFFLLFRIIYPKINMYVVKTI